MCLVLLWFSARSDVDVVLAGNRDEFYRRPSEPPAIVSRNPTVYAGKDLEAGGTWMGRNESGLLAAITNRYGSSRAVAARPRSRGEIVLRLLRHRDAAGAAAWAASIPLKDYRAFNLLFGSAEAFYFLSSEEGGPPRSLEPGFHALSNSTLNDSSWPKVARSHRFAEAHRQRPGEALIGGLQAFLTDRTPPDDKTPASREEEIHGALGAVFIQTPDYGTVSSTIVTTGGGLGDRYYFAEGEDMRRTAGDGANPYRLVRFGPE